MHEEYIPPVGFAREPTEDRKRWVLRIVTGILIIAISWILIYRVIRTDTSPVPSGPGPSQLPGPL